MAQLNRLNLRELEEHSSNISETALNPNAHAQEECFGMKFPSGCDYYRGPHDIDCLISIWLSVGCVKEGYDYPNNYSRPKLLYMRSLNLRQVKSQMDHLKQRALRNDQHAQLYCFGRKFPSGCRYYRGPHSRQCLLRIWYKVGCVRLGYKNPVNLSSSEIAGLSRLNLAGVEEKMNNYTIDASTPNLDVQAQKDCYGMLFPPSCKYYRGPHPAECQRYMWLKVGCLKEGYEYPYNITPSKNDSLNKLNLRQLWHYYNNLTILALRPDPQLLLWQLIPKPHVPDRNPQLACFGMVFPKGCEFYRGPHSEECFESAFLRTACRTAGRKNPTKLPAIEKRRLSGLNLRELLNYTFSIAEKAIFPKVDKDAQLDCFGIEFPLNCKYFRGPHDLACMNTIWKNVSCFDEGTGSPLRLPPANLARLSGMLLADLQAYMQNISNRAVGRDATAQMLCYGLAYPPNCLSFNPPLSLACYTSIWLNMGCRESGTDFPPKITLGKVTALWGGSNLRDTIRFMRASPYLSAIGGSATDQVRCYGKAFPPGCVTYDGPHTLACMKTIWANSGCIKNGYDYPENLSKEKNDTLNKMNLVKLEWHMGNISTRAQVGNVRDQLDCYGLRFPSDCLSFSGPHSLNCLVSVWDKVGCQPQGTNHPSLPTSTLNSTLRNKNLAEIIDELSSIFDLATTSKQSQLDCFGIEFPDKCKKYWGPHSIACILTIRKEAGLAPEGWNNPNNWSQTDNATFNPMNLRQLINFMDNVNRSAVDNQVVFDQNEGFGLKFYPKCYVYWPQLTIECINSIWLDVVKCSDKGARYPGNLIYFLATTASTSGTTPPSIPVTSNFYNVWGNMNQRQVRNVMQAIKDKALALDPASLLNGVAIAANNKAQIDCYGTAFPILCTTFYGPHRDHCINKIRELAGLVPEGWNNPANVSKRRRQQYDAMTVKELQDLMVDINTKALAQDRGAQEQGFGLVFYPHCDYYLPRLTAACLNSIWEDVVECVVEGNEYPATLSPSELARKWSKKNQRQARATMQQMFDDSHKLSNTIVPPYNAKAAFNSTAQMECFGLEFPAGCQAYVGPHTDQCFYTIQRMVGFVALGWYNPENFTAHERRVLNAFNLRELIDYMRDLAKRAGFGDEASQMSIYGMKFFTNCTKYEPLLSIGCLNSIWKFVVGCTEDGKGYPGILRYIDRIKRYGKANQRVANRSMWLVKEAALRNNGTHAFNLSAQVECYGSAFPPLCLTYEGPHSIHCIHVIRMEANLVFEGWNNPENWTSLDAMLFQPLTLAQLKEHMNDIYTRAHAGEVMPQFQGFGMAFLPNCPDYHSRLSLACILSMWSISTGCVQEGFGYPGRLNAFELNRRWGGANQRQAINEMRRIKLTALTPGRNNGTFQQECYGLVFPAGCFEYRGPHSNHCIESARLLAGLAKEGWNHPSNISKALNNTLQKMNLRELLDYFRNIANEAYDDDVDQQFAGFGLDFYPNCTSVYHPPLPLRCLVSLWIDVAGCKKEGYGYPEDTTHSLLGVNWNNKNQREAKEAMKLIYEVAISPNEVYQKECFGGGVPVWMYVTAALGVKLVLTTLAIIILNRRREILQIR